MNWFILVFLTLFSFVEPVKGKEPVLDRVLKDVAGVLKGEMHEAETALTFYLIHSIDLKTGKGVWGSPVLLHYATQYSLDEWKGETVLVASMIDLSHWKFK